MSPSSISFSRSTSTSACSARWCASCCAAAGGAPAGPLQGRGQRGGVAGPAAQDVDPRAVEGQHGHPVGRASAASGRARASPAPRCGCWRARRSRRRRPGSSAPPPPPPPPAPAAPPAGAVDGRAFPSSTSVKYSTGTSRPSTSSRKSAADKPADPLPLPVGDHRLDVDHPDVDRLPEDLRHGCRGSGCCAASGRAPCQQDHDPAKKSETHGSSFSPPRQPSR